jgi:hypothetical protein
MTVLTAIKTAGTCAPAATEAPSPGLWQLGIENQELTSRVARLAEQLDSDDDETRIQAITELEATLLQEEGHRQALDSKADSYCWVIEHLRAQASYRQQQAKRLVELARSEESLVLVLTKLQPAATRFSFPHHELTSRKSQAVEIDDEEALPPEWLAHKTTSQPDKAAIKEALKAGHSIPGAQLTSRRSWRIR